MQKTTIEYASSMKNQLRGRGYIMVSFGVINQEAQQSGSIENDKDLNMFTYFSNSSSLFEDKKTVQMDYSTLEENYTKVDGSQLFLPRNGNESIYYNSGLVARNIVSQAPSIIKIDTNTKPIDVKGVTIDFGENYPTKFSITTYPKSKTIEYTNNKEEFVTQDVFEGITALILKVNEMKNKASRVRIKTFKFGFGLIYKNDTVMGSDLTSYVSPICEDVSQIDFSVKLNNRDRYFDVDNPESAINFLEIGQEMDVSYGYEVSEGKVEWIKGQHLYCNSWKTDDTTATITAQDIFRRMTKEYHLGKVADEGVSYYDLAKSVLDFAEVENYQIDSRLKKLKTKNPIPRVPCKQALQIIANATRCILTQDRDGTVKLKGSFIPRTSISSDNQTTYSNIENVLTNNAFYEYAEYGTDYVTIDGSMKFYPREGSFVYYTGYVSNSKSDSNNTFTKNPIITVTQETSYNYYSMAIQFGNAKPSEFIIRTYRDNVLLKTYTITKEMIGAKTEIDYDLDDFNKMDIEFTKTENPYNRIIVKSIQFGDVSNFVMERLDMMSSPKAVKNEIVQEVIVPVYTYSEVASNAELEQLTQVDVNVTSTNNVYSFYFSDASYGYSASVENNATSVTIVDSSSYYIAVKFNSTGNFKLIVNGHKYKITESAIVNTLNNRGKSIKWKNPMISDSEMGKDLANWVGDYYDSPTEYEYKTRGNPELDANDIIYQENDFEKNMQVKVYEAKITFNQSFSGSVKARKVV